MFLRILLIVVQVGSSATTAQRHNQLIIPELVIDDRDEQNDKRPLSNTNTNISEV